jgi:hypothetical protein
MSTPQSNEKYLWAYEVVDRLRERFTSGNAVPVDRAHLTRDEYRALLTFFNEDVSPHSALGESVTKALTALKDAT